MAPETYTSLPADITNDLGAIESMLEQLKERAGRDYGSLPDGYSGVMTQGLFAPDFHIAFVQALPLCGFEAVTRYAVGGEGVKTVLWVNSSASEEHIGKVRGLGTTKWRHPIGSLLSKASSGEFHFRIDKEGKVISRDQELTGLAKEIAPAAFMLSHLIAHIRSYKIDPHETALYAEFRSQEHRPLDFEQMGGLALRVLRENLRANPDLAV